MKLATLCYVEHDNKYLMLHRNKKANDMHKGRWIGLGGKLEAGESPEECVIREVYEESGLQLTNPTLRGFLTFPSFDGENDWYVFLFTATEFTGEIKPCNEGELQWIDKSKLHELPMHEGDYLFIDKLMKDDCIFTMKHVYENGVLKSTTTNNYS